MTHSSWPNEPVELHHIDCGSVWQMWAVEWPPQIAFCAKCATALKLVGQDDKTRQLTYRQIT